MSLLQENLSGDDRVLAFAVFHVLIRGGLAAAAIGSGVAADLLGVVRWPLVGRVAPERVVLACSGVVVFLSSGFVQRRAVRNASR